MKNPFSGLSEEEILEPPPVPRWIMIFLSLMAFAIFVLFSLGTWEQYVDGRVRGDAVQVFDMMLSRFAVDFHLTHIHSGNHFFKNHLMLWLYPTGFIYKIHDSLWTYLTLLNLALSAAIIPLGLLAWNKTRSALMVVAVCILYATGQFTGSLRLAVHPESLIPIGWFLLFWAAETNRQKWAWIAFAWLSCIKEDQPLWIFVYALWALFFKRIEFRLGIKLAIAGIVGWLLMMVVMRAIPMTGQSELTGFFWLSRFSGGGEGGGSPIVWLLQNPSELFSRMFLNRTWFSIVMAGALLCLVGWKTMLLIIPQTLFLFVAEAEYFRNMQYYYSYLVLAPVIYACIDGAEILNQRVDQKNCYAYLSAWIFLVSIFNVTRPTLTDGWGQFGLREPIQVNVRNEIGRKLVQQTMNDAPPETIVAVHYELASWMPRGRQMIFLNKANLEKADLVIADNTRVSADLGRDLYLELLNYLYSAESPWIVQEDLDGIVVFKKN